MEKYCSINYWNTVFKLGLNSRQERTLRDLCSAVSDHPMFPAAQRFIRADDGNRLTRRFTGEAVKMMLQGIVQCTDRLGAFLDAANAAYGPKTPIEYFDEKSSSCKRTPASKQRASFESDLYWGWCEVYDYPRYFGPNAEIENPDRCLSITAEEIALRFSFKENSSGRR